MTDVKKRRDLSLIEKINIIEHYDKLPKTSQRSAAVKLKISQPLLCKILKDRDKIEASATKNNNLNTKRKRKGKYDRVESALKIWFTNSRRHNTRINGPLMRQKAEELAKTMGYDNFVATEGWFYRWKKRENINFTDLSEEDKQSMDISSCNPIEFVSIGPNTSCSPSRLVNPIKERNSCSSDNSVDITTKEILEKAEEIHDEFDLLGKIIACKLRRFPKDIRILSEKLLNDVLYLAESGSINKNSMIVSNHINFFNPQF